MLPGKKYKPEDYLWILWTRKWFLIVPTVIAAVGTFIWSYQLPNRFRSSTTILVVPQRVPESFVRSTVTAGVAERLQTISQQILSRTRLERIIEEFDLYPAERQRMIMEDIVQLMRTRDIKVDVASPRQNEDSTHFSVTFESSNPRTAMQVVDRLASMFVQENLDDRAGLADSTNQFLQAQLEDARRRLVEHEAKLEAFRQRNSGQLPSQVQANIQMMQMTQSQIQSNIDEANRARDRLAVIEQMIADAVSGVDQPLSPVTPGTIATPDDIAPSAPLAQQLESARTLLRNLQEGRGLKPTHPDVARVSRIVADLEAKVAAVAPASSEPATATPTTGPLPTKVADLQLQAEELRRRLAHLATEDERLKRNASAYASRLEMAPKLESELTELMRDYTTLEAQYTSLLMKGEESKMAVNLERRQIGEQFKIIDGARLPERPFSPDRARLNTMGVIAGLGIGLALIFLLEYRDTSVKSDDDIVASLALPVLAVIPAMRSAADRRRAKRRRVAVAVCASVVLTVGAAAAIAWRLRLLDGWLR